MTAGHAPALAKPGPASPAPRTARKEKAAAEGPRRLLDRFQIQF
jgi:hypothetical protein